MFVILTRGFVWLGLLAGTYLYGWGFWNYGLPALLYGGPVGFLGLIFLLPAIYVATWGLWSAWKAGLRATAPKLYARLEDITWLPL